MDARPTQFGHALKYPIFIVGSPRSGTSILVQALQNAGYAGCNEGNLLSLLRPLDLAIDGHFVHFAAADPLVLTSHITRERLKESVFGAVRRMVDSFHEGRPWLDKTGNPEMIEAIPVLRALWPESRFIFAKRRGIENLVSRLKKFPGFSFEYHCRDWARNMATWRRVTAADPSLPFIEVDQWDIGNSPVEAAAEIAGFLGLDAAQQGLVVKSFVHDRPQETARGTALRTLTMAETGWSEARMAAFHALCLEEMFAFGYTDDESYRAVAAA